MRKLLWLGLITALLSNQGAQAIDITWDGGDGDWDDLNWNNGQDIFNLTDTLNCSQGWRSSANEDEQENIQAEIDNRLIQEFSENGER